MFSDTKDDVKSKDMSVLEEGREIFTSPRPVERKRFKTTEVSHQILSDTSDQKPLNTSGISKK